MPPRTTRKSYRPRVSDRTMVGTSPPRCLTAQKPKAFRTSKNESSKRKKLGTSPDHAGWKPGPNLRRVLALGEVFCLDIPFHRTGLPETWSPKIHCRDRIPAIPKQVRA